MLHAQYKRLLEKHGAQGWWPLNGQYNPGDYSHPKNEAQRFEICVGAILTQNTAWKNAEKALKEMIKQKLLSAEAITESPLQKLSAAIKPAGYYNQKAKKLKIFSKFFAETKKPEREQLLGLWGIGEETADSILLYAYKQPEFVVDAYTKRLFKLNKPYAEIKAMFENALPKDYRIYNEFHALIVAEGKRAAANSNRK
ncbi:endonuclease III domain-containing protein [Candidatus Woesearchaeota archaeon]|nr:endonuclease III domain-containing protein [Candidatus Woesearchaeota archaeon]